MKDIIRMNQLAGIITEGQARKMMAILNENEGTESRLNELEFGPDEIPTVQQFKDEYLGPGEFIKLNINGQEYEALRASEYGKASYLVRKKGETNRLYDILGYDNLKTFLLTGKVNPKFVNITKMNNPDDPSGKDGMSYVHQGYSRTPYLENDPFHAEWKAKLEKEKAKQNNK